MKAKTGDRITIRGHNLGDRDRKGRVIEVRGDDGGPPFVVVWDDDPGEHLFFPGSDAEISTS